MNKRVGNYWASVVEADGKMCFYIVRTVDNGSGYGLGYTVPVEQELSRADLEREVQKQMHQFPNFQQQDFTDVLWELYLRLTKKLTLKNLIEMLSRKWKHPQYLWQMHDFQQYGFFNGHEAILEKFARELDRQVDCAEVTEQIVGVQQIFDVSFVGEEQPFMTLIVDPNITRRRHSTVSGNSEDLGREW